MKAENLKLILKKLIQEEVKKAVAEEVQKAMGKVLVEMVREIKNVPTPKQQLDESVEEVIDVPTPKTRNSKINNVLQETAKNFKPLKKTVNGSLAELMDGGFDKIGTHEDVGYAEPATNMDFLKQMVAQTPQVPTQPSALDGGTEVPDALKKVFKRDFRAVMKRIDEHKKNGGGGYINPTGILGG